MLHFLIENWPYALLLVGVCFGSSGYESPEDDVYEERRKWAAHPMNPLSMNWVGD